MLNIGLRLHDAKKQPLPLLLKEVRSQGFTCGHLALSKLFKELPCTPSALNPGYAAYLKNVFRQENIDIAVLGNYLNLATPDPEALKYNLEMYYAHIRFASLLGCSMVGTETGAPNTGYRFCPECRSDKAFSELVKNLKPVIRCAEQFGVIVAIEPVCEHIIYNGKRAKQIIEEIGSPNLQILFDPVNLLDSDNVGFYREVYSEFIEDVGEHIAMLHLKDFIPNETKHRPDPVGVGFGIMDYTEVLGFVKKEKPFMFATLENTTPENAEICRMNVQRIYDGLQIV